ncbi:MAG: CehA/McbA family metallohydrolase [Candidatus Bathyarchaeia archaeon]
MPLKIDLHVHTCYSKDSQITLEDILTQAKKKGLDGIAVTDHDTVEGAIKIANIIERNQKHGRLIIIPGIEVSTVKGHILGINVLTRIPKGLSVEETIERIHEAGGLAIAAHPKAPFKNGLGLNPKILSFGLDAIEVINSSSFPFQLLTRSCKKFAERYNLPQTAGSDSHIPEAIGLAYTLIESDESSLDNLIESIRKGLTRPFGRSMPIKLRVKKALGVKA